MKKIKLPVTQNLAKNCFVLFIVNFFSSCVQYTPPMQPTSVTTTVPQTVTRKSVPLQKELPAKPSILNETKFGQPHSFDYREADGAGYNASQQDYTKKKSKDPTRYDSALKAQGYTPEQIIIFHRSYEDNWKFNHNWDHPNNTKTPWNN